MRESLRILAPPGEDYLEMQIAIDRIQRVRWMEDLVAPGGWEVMATFSFRWEASVESARRCYARWIRKRLPGVSWFYSIEGNPSRGGCHVHSLWADCKSVYRKAIWEEVVKKWGRARIEPVKSKTDSSAYAAKYLCKPSGWFDVYLQWHRLQRINSAVFKLSDGEPINSVCVTAGGQVEEVPRVELGAPATFR